MRALFVVAAVIAVGGPAHAADITDVATAFEEGNRFDFRMRVSYEHHEKRAQIKRERIGLSPDQDAVAQSRDLWLAERRDLIGIRSEMSLYRGLALHVELPIIIEQSSTYTYDRGITVANSTTIADGILPMGGFDANNSGVAFASGSDMVFRSVKRGARGGGRAADAFDTINFGLTWAPVTQKRDHTKPTWTLGVQARVSIGTIKAFDRAQPEANRGVADGVHRLDVFSTVSKRFRWFEPYFGFSYTAPLATRSDSLFVDYGPAQREQRLQHEAGALFGTETILVEKRRTKLVLDTRLRLDGRFSGRGYSEAWEILAGSPALACDAVQNPACDSNATLNPYQGRPYTGITVIENHATFGALAGLVAQLGRYFRIRAAFDYRHDQSHLITGDDIGKPMTAGGRVTEPGEFNPAYRAVTDLVGRRYRVDNVNVYNAYVWAQLMF